MALRLACISALANRRTEAQETIAGLDFERFPKDMHWLASLCFLGDAVALLDDETRAQRLLDLLRPYASRNALVGGSVVCLGPVARVMGRLAATVGRLEEAEASFEHALAACDAMRATVWGAVARVQLADVLQAGGNHSRAAELLAEAEETGRITGCTELLTRMRVKGTTTDASG